MNSELYPGEYKERIAKLRWLQVTELKHKYPNDADLGAEVRKLVNNTN